MKMFPAAAEVPTFTHFRDIISPPSARLLPATTRVYILWSGKSLNTLGNFPRTLGDAR